MIAHQWINHDIFTLRGFFTLDECAAAIRLSEEQGYTNAPINTAFGPQVRADVRNNRRVMVDDSERAAGLWARVADFVPTHVGAWRAVGVNERFRYYRYDVGQQFDWHLDGYFERDNGERSHLTFMIYLNDDFEGGQTSFSDCHVEPEQGMALLFTHAIWHKGEPVAHGRKYVLRTDVMYRRA